MTYIFFLDLKDLLEKQSEAFLEEKQKLMNTIQKLESDIYQLMLEFQKQNSNLKESQDTFKSREQTLIRDREILVEQSVWERERFQVS